MPAKKSSFLAQVFAALWVAVLAILKGLGKIQMEMTDIILSGGAIAAAFCPVFVSIWLEKIRDIKWGGSYGNQPEYRRVAGAAGGGLAEGPGPVPGNKFPGAYH
jgi:hypothetical protein